VAFVRFINKHDVDKGRTAYVLTFPSDLDYETVLGWLRAISRTLKHSKFGASQSMVFEMIATENGIVHKLYIPWQREDDIIPQLRALARGVDATPQTEFTRINWTYAVEIGESSKSRPLSIPNPAATAASILAAAHPLGENEALLLQWVVSPAPHQPLPQKSARTVESKLLGKVNLGEANADEIAERRAKLQEPNVMGVLRVAARANTLKRAKHLTDRIRTSYASTSTPHNQWIKRFGRQQDIIERTKRASSMLSWPAQLSVSELAALIAWPFGNPNVPGLPRGSARLFPAHRGVLKEGIRLGINPFPGQERPVALGYTEALTHTWIGGKTGVGKSALMQNIAAQVMRNGNGLILMEAEGDLYDGVLNRVPPDRADDVVLLDFSDTHNLVGFNVLDQPSHPDVAIDHIIELFEHKYSNGLWADEYFYNGMKTLGSFSEPLAFTDLIPLLAPQTDAEKQWASDIIASVSDVELKRWWQRHNDREKQAKQQRIEPVLSRIGQLVSRPELRYVFGQRQSSFKISDVLAENKILLVNLKGISKNTASLVSTLLMDATWHAIKNTQKETPTFLMLDEFADFMDLPVSFETMLAQARKRNVGMVLANQHLSQLTQPVREGVLGNARNKVVLQSKADDAKTLIKEMGGGLAMEDITNLQRFEAVVDIVTPTGTSGPVTIRTHPPSGETNQARRVVAISRQKYARPLHEVQAEMFSRYEKKNDAPDQQRRRPKISGEDWN
jgi:hypothetical protein